MTNNWVDIMQRGADHGPTPLRLTRWALSGSLNHKRKMTPPWWWSPRFNRSAAVADLYAPIRAGSDTAFLLGVIRYLLENDRIQHDYVRHYTNASLLIRDDYQFEDGVFSGYDAKNASTINRAVLQLDEKGNALRDETLSHPRCVWNLLKKHVERYTPEMVNRLCGTSLADFNRICEILASTSVPDRTATILYALGWTHHSAGAQIIRAAAMLQLLLGNIGMAGGGVNALRGHSNIQGYTDLGLLSTNLPGYMPLPSEKQPDYQTYISQITPPALGVNEVNYWQNTPKFFISMMKSFWGEHATAENNWGYDWLPKWDRLYDVMTQAELMLEGKINGYIVQGFNPLAFLSGTNASCIDLFKSDKAKQTFNHANNPLRSVSRFFNTIKKLTCINNHIRVMVSRFD
jgi:formate dehydrogenase major subunit/formate dehydrogenase-N alpha subunit